MKLPKVFMSIVENDKKMIKIGLKIDIKSTSTVQVMYVHLEHVNIMSHSFV